MRLRLRHSIFVGGFGGLTPPIMRTVGGVPGGADLVGGMPKPQQMLWPPPSAPPPSSSGGPAVAAAAHPARRRGRGVNAAHKVRTFFFLQTGSPPPPCLGRIVPLVASNMLTGEARVGLGTLPRERARTHAFPVCRLKLRNKFFNLKQKTVFGLGDASRPLSDWHGCSCLYLTGHEQIKVTKKLGNRW